MKEICNICNKLITHSILAMETPSLNVKSPYKRLHRVRYVFLKSLYYR